MDFNNVDFGSDSKVIIDAFHKNRIDVTKTGCILSACRRLFSSQFTNSMVEFHRRQVNVAAHTLAEATPLLTSPAILYHVPHCIEQLIINEML